MHTGSDAFIQMLVDAGVKFIFGNPGTTELPLMDALAGDKRLSYILGLQEVPVVAMADGYAQASRSLGVVNLHISCGLGNAMGMLYNAFQEGTPLLVTAGQQDRRIALEEPVLWSDMVALTRPWTKWSCEVQRLADLPRAVRRAVQTALTPPTGPVFLSIPLDVQMEAGELDLSPASPLDYQFCPPPAAVESAAALLAAAKNPVILSGSRVTEADAVAPLIRVAELLGATVFSESGTSHGRLPFPCQHALYGGCLPLWSPEMHERLSPYDVALVAGMNVLRQYLYHEPAPIPPGLKLVHVDSNAWELGKNYPLTVGVWGHLQPSLVDLADRIEELQSSEQRQAARQRLVDGASGREAEQRSLDSEILNQRAERPLSPLTAMSSIARALPHDVAVVEEAVTTTNNTLERLGAIRDASGYFGHRGWALGWGLGCALGVKLAWPERPVLGILGDGAALYGIQGLWTAAHYRLPVTFVICNNAQYQILKAGGRSLRLPQAMAGNFLGQDINQPQVDFVSLARSLGVDAVRVEDPDELTTRLEESLRGDRPRLIDVPIQRQTPQKIVS